MPAGSITASEHQWVCTCVCPKPEHNSFLVILVTQPFSQLLSFRRSIIILLLEECVWEEHLWDRIQPGLTADFTSQGIKACPPPPSAFPETTTRWQCSAKACCPGSCQCFRLSPSPCPFPSGQGSAQPFIPMCLFLSYSNIAVLWKQ